MLSQRTPDWRPDPDTLRWILATIDEEQVGQHVQRQVADLINTDPDSDVRTDLPPIARLGEAAVESVVFTAFAMIENPLPSTPTSEPI